jgi:hypothetical protein
MPAEDTEEFKLYGVLGEDHEPPKFAGEATPPIVIAPSTECLEVDGETKYMMGSRAFLLPLGNHGIPLGIPFDPAYCYCGETLAEACQAFTGLPDEAYTWMRKNGPLDTFLFAVCVDTPQMKVPMHFVGELNDSWKAWKAEDSLDSRMTINQAETSLIWKILSDNWTNSGTKQMIEKWKAWLAKALIVIKQSPDLEQLHREHVLNCNFLPAVCTPATKSWQTKFLFQSFLASLPVEFKSFTNVTLAHDESVDKLAKLIIKGGEPAPAAAAPQDDSTMRSSATAYLKRYFADLGEPTGTPIRKETASDRKRPPNGEQPPVKELFFEKQSDISVMEGPPPVGKKQKTTLERFKFREEDDEVGVREPPPTSYLVPHEQQATYLRPLYTQVLNKLISAPSETSAFLIPTALPEASVEWFNCTEYFDLSLSDARIQQAHFGAQAFPPEMLLGPALSAAAGKIFPDNEFLLPGIVSMNYRANVLTTKATDDAKTISFFERNLMLVSNAPNPLGIIQPAFAEPDFYTNSDSIKALRSGCFASGASFSIKEEVLTASLTPMHYIPTVQKGYRLPEAGWTARQCLDYTQNQVFVFNHMFMSGNRYPAIKKLNDCLSPWLLTGPLAGQYAFILNVFSQRKLTTFWDKQEPTSRLQTTIAFIIAFQELWSFFLDWSNTPNREEHCFPAIFLRTKADRI